MKNNEQARTRRLEQALNYVLGYLDALAAYAATPEQRESAEGVSQMIIGHLTYVAPPEARERDEREQAGNCVDGMSV